MLSENPSQEKPNSERTDEPTDEHTGQSEPPVPPTPTEPQPPPTPAHDKPACQKKRDWLDYIKFWAEILGLGVLIVYTAFTALLWRENKKAADAAKSAAEIAASTLQSSNKSFRRILEQIKQQTAAQQQTADSALGQAAATNKLAREAKRATDIAQLALITADRPWIGVKTVSINLAQGQPARFNVVFTNFGKSPATHLLINMGYRFDSPPPNDTKYTVKPLHFGEEPSESTIMPGQDTSMPESIDESLIPTTEQMQFINSGRIRLYFFGEARYFDWHGGAHYTHFCAIYSSSVSPQVCREYNDAN